MENQPKETKMAPILGTHRDALDVVREYGPAVAIGVILALAIFIGYTFYSSQDQVGKDRASELLLNAASAEELQTVIDQYPNTPAAPLALLALAAERYHENDVASARSHYETFMTQYPKHDMVPTAKFGLAHCAEVEGAMEQARDAFKELHQKHPDHYLAPLAKFGEARILMAWGELDAAHSIYDDYLEQDPDGPWASQAFLGRLGVERQRRAITATN